MSIYIYTYTHTLKIGHESYTSSCSGRWQPDFIPCPCTCCNPMWAMFGGLDSVCSLFVCVFLFVNRAFSLVPFTIDWKSLSQICSPFFKCSFKCLLGSPGRGKRTRFQPSGWATDLSENWINRLVRYQLALDFFCYHGKMY
jgi:hypothetical protein